MGGPFPPRLGAVGRKVEGQRLGREIALGRKAQRGLDVKPLPWFKVFRCLSLRVVRARGFRPLAIRVYRRGNMEKIKVAPHVAEMAAALASAIDAEILETVRSGYVDESVMGELKALSEIVAELRRLED